MNRHAPFDVRVAALVLLAALSACAQQATVSPPKAEQAAPATANPPAVASLPSLDAPEATGTTGEAAPAIRPSAELVGIDSEEMQRLFGPPALRRQEGAAEVWQYSARDCVMDAFLYAPAEGAATQQVAYVEFRESGLGVLPEGTDRERCYAEVLVEQRQRTMR